jgi:hypothetical protein
MIFLNILLNVENGQADQVPHVSFIVYALCKEHVKQSIHDPCLFHQSHYIPLIFLLYHITAAIKSLF